jgi:CxxC motif-containing protein (DUF1111 family)
MNRIRWASCISALATLGALGCSATAEPETTVATEHQELTLGDTLPGTNAALFTEAKAAFQNVESINDGVGPIFNERSCGGCHANGAVGGAGENIERRFGRFANGQFDALANLGGTLRQLFSVGNFNNPNLPAASRGRCQAGNPTLCCIPVEVEPPQATVHNVGRLTTPLFGLGLVDSIPDSFFTGLAAAEPAAIRGVVSRVPVILPNPGDPTQSINSSRVGRFGWKAGVPNLVQFSADAYSNEMAITTQSCFHGTNVNAFAIENAPNAPNGSVPIGCDDLAPLQPPENVAAGIPQGTDDAVGPCGTSRTEIQDDVFLFASFMTALAPPPRDLSDQIAVTRGEPLFTSTGCAGCHVTTTFHTPANPFPLDIGDGSETMRVPGNFAFNPYSDFLKHDMGSLGDQIGNAPPDDPTLPGDSLAVTRQMRTAPLWGLRFRNHLLHDGRASDVPSAVRAHDGQGAAARDAFNRLSSANQHNLVQFVRSL